jgi:STE24 endopeptidase
MTNAPPETAMFSAADASFTVTLVLALALMSGLLVRAWLASRQIRHVSLHRAQVPADFASTISLGAHQKAADYTVSKLRLGLIDMAIDAAILLGWTLMGGLNWLNQTLLHAMGPGLWQQVALVAAFVAIGALLGLPVSLYQTFVLEERFGFNRVTPKLWFTDMVKGVAVGAVIGLPLLALLLWVMGAMGTSWWLWAWGLWVGFNLLLLLIYPTFIAPLFNQFKPLEDETLKARVTALMARCGFSAKGLFVMDGSKRSAHANAYFTGFGAAKRVVFFDTLLNKLSPGEVDAVLAHELGHFKHKHIIQRMVQLFGMSLLGFALLGWLSSQVFFYTGLGVLPSLQGGNDALALLLFMMVMPLLSFFISPLMARLSRQHEFQADAYAVAQTHGADLRSALLKLFEDNAATLTPDPLYAAFYYSHPPATERLQRMTS